MTTITEEPTVFSTDTGVTVRFRLADGDGDVVWRILFNELAAQDKFDAEAMGHEDRTVLSLRMPKGTDTKTARGLIDKVRETIRATDNGIGERRRRNSEVELAAGEWWRHYKQYG